MSNHLFAAVEAGLVIAVVFGVATWQLVSVRRSIGRDRRSGETAKPPAP